MAKDTQDTPAEVSETKPHVETAPPKVGARGIRAMQGEPQSAEKLDGQDPTTKGRKAESVPSRDLSEAFPAAPPDVASQSQERADRTSSDAIRGKAHLAAEQALADKGVTGVLDARRHASEASAIATLGGEATSLDEAAENLGMKGNNYPTYDIASSREVVSVKTHWADDGSLSDSARQAYQRDFTHMLGWGRGTKALEQDGQNIIDARDSSVPVPDELRGATPEQATAYLRDRSLLMVPDDHVDTVKADLRAKVIELPTNYFLPENPSESQVEGVLNRVRGLGLISDELHDIVAKLEK